MNKKIINFCPTGTQTNKTNSLAPIEINEIVDEVIEMFELGITIVHLHARDEDGNNTYKKEIFQKILEKIQLYSSELVTSVSLSGRYFNDINLRTEVLSLNPDMGSLTMSSMNFMKSSVNNDPDTIQKLITSMDKYGVVPEVECFDGGMLNYTTYLQKKGILREKLYVNLILGNIFNASDTIDSISHLKNHFPSNSKICFGGIGKSQLRSNLFGLLEGDGVRIGLEDNLYFKDKIKATNLDLLSRIKSICNTLELEIMTPNEFRKLGILHEKG
jgi:3-keto-5-aminohexanoate cleavage enzyme